MIAHVICQHCSQEFEADITGKTEFCPHCGKETRVRLAPFKPAAAANVTRLTSCGDCAGAISPHAILCPHCGNFRGITFRLMFQIVCLVISSFALLTLIGALFTAAIHAIGFK